MSSSDRDPATTPRNELERAVAEADPGFLAELASFLKHEKKWWLLPIVIVMALLGVLVVLGSSSVAPFLYTFF